MFDSLKAFTDRLLARWRFIAPTWMIAGPDLAQPVARVGARTPATGPGPGREFRYGFRHFANLGGRCHGLGHAWTSSCFRLSAYTMR